MFGRWNIVKKQRLAIFDLDGTLFDTKDVNFNAYNKALLNCGFLRKLDYQYYCDYCNGNNYKYFLPEIIDGISEDEMKFIHNEKKLLYSYYHYNNHSNTGNQVSLKIHNLTMLCYMH